MIIQAPREQISERLSRGTLHSLSPPTAPATGSKIQDGSSSLHRPYLAHLRLYIFLGGFFVDASKGAGNSEAADILVRGARIFSRSELLSVPMKITRRRGEAGDVYINFNVFKINFICVIIPSYSQSSPRLSKFIYPEYRHQPSKSIQCRRFHRHARLALFNDAIQETGQTQ